MCKIQKISEIEPNLFYEYDFFEIHRKAFNNSELGKLSKTFPIETIASDLELQESTLGRTSYFSPYSKVALMLLKHYTRLSDRELLMSLNGNVQYQLFCGIKINPSTPLTNFKIISEIRCEIGAKLNTKKLEPILANHWKRYLGDLNTVMMDATCYPSSMRYPTDPKLLWESIFWIHKELKMVCKTLKQSMPRSKYLKQIRKYKSYSKKRKRSKSETKVLKRSLLHLLDKLLNFLSEKIDANKNTLSFTPRFYRRLSTIKKILDQQQQLFAGKEVKNRIVSIDKNYIHPIIRGKEQVAVEFGAKVNAIQVGGVNFIQHLSFSANNECLQLKPSVEYAQQLFRKKITLLGADAIYGSNKNRSYCTSKNITTSFIRKGKASKYEEQKAVARKVLSKERATRLEGSFGIEKEKYTLNKIKARTLKTEICWIFFGIHTANAVRMIPKMFKEETAKKKSKKAA